MNFPFHCFQFKLLVRSFCHTQKKKDKKKNTEDISHSQKPKQKKIYSDYNITKMKNDELEDFSKIYEEEQKQNNIEKFYIKKKKISELSQIQNYNQKANAQKSQQQKEQVMISEVHTLLSEGTIAMKYLPWKYFFCFMIVLGVQTCSSIVFEDYFSLFLELLLFCVSPLHYFEQQPKRRTLILYTWSALISLEAIQQFRLNKPFIFHLLMMLTCLLILNQLYSLIRYYKQITKSLTPAPSAQAIQDQLD